MKYIIPCLLFVGLTAACNKETGDVITTDVTTDVRPAPDTETQAFDKNAQLEPEPPLAYERSFNVADAPRIDMPELDTNDVEIRRQLLAFQKQRDAARKHRERQQLAQREQSAKSSSRSMVTPVATGTGQVVAAEEIIFTLTREGCQGTCPEYALTVLADGRLRYEGQESADRVGVFYCEPAGNRWHELVDKFRAFAGTDPRPVYPVDADVDARAPAVVLTYLDANAEVRPIRVLGAAPAEFTAIVNSVDALVDNEVWRSE